MKKLEYLKDKYCITATITDEIGKFWVVTKASRKSQIDDILFETDVIGMRMQFLGGLSAVDIVGFYKDENRARKVAEDELKRVK